MHVVGTTKNQITVYVDLGYSSAARQISRRPYLLTIASEAISGLELDPSRLIMTYDMGRAIGYDFVVDVTDPDTLFYAQIDKDTVYTPFTKKGEPVATKLLTTILRQEEDGTYMLDNLWLGPFRPPLPGDLTEVASSKEYWAAHAYVFEDQHLKANSITKQLPY